MHHGSCRLLTDLLLQSKPIPIAGLGLRKLGSSTSASPRAWLSTANETGVACTFFWTSTAQLAPRLLLPVGGDRILDLLQLRLTDRGADQSVASVRLGTVRRPRGRGRLCAASRHAGQENARSRSATAHNRKLHIAGVCAAAHNRMFVDAEVWLGAMEAPDSPRSAAGRGLLVIDPRERRPHRLGPTSSNTGEGSSSACLWTTGQTRPAAESP